MYKNHYNTIILIITNHEPLIIPNHRIYHYIIHSTDHYDIP